MDPIYMDFLLTSENKFNEDLSMKAFFERISDEEFIPLINKLCGTKCSLDAKVLRDATEHNDLLGSLGKGCIRGDFCATIQDGEVDTKVIIEFQSTKQKDMAYRMFIYAFHMSLSKHDSPHRIMPRSAIIYTHYTEQEEKEGTVNFNLQLDCFSIAGKDFPRGTEITVKFPYINTSVMDLEDFSQSPLEPLQVFHLLRYKRKPVLLESPTAIEEIDKVHQFVGEQRNNHNFLYTELFHNLMADILSAGVKSNKVSQEVLTMINTTYGRTSSQIIMDDGRNEGRNEGIALGRNEGIALGRNEGIALGRNEGIALGRNEGIALGEEIGAKKTRIQIILSAYQRLGDKDIVCTAFDCTLEELDHILSTHTL